jgi:hypothetical protein
VRSGFLDPCVSLLFPPKFPRFLYKIEPEQELIDGEGVRTGR